MRLWKVFLSNAFVEVDNRNSSHVFSRSTQDRKQMYLTTSNWSLLTDLLLIIDHELQVIMAILTDVMMLNHLRFVHLKEEEGENSTTLTRASSINKVIN